MLPENPLNCCGLVAWFNYYYWTDVYLFLLVWKPKPAGLRSVVNSVVVVAFWMPVPLRLLQVMVGAAFVFLVQVTHTWTELA